MADNDSGVSGFGWFLAGLGIGALVGVLYAPKSGKETRDDLVASALDARDKAQGYYTQGTEAVNQYVDKGKDLIQSQAEKVTAAVEAGKQAYTTTANDQPQS
jgi:gas vesicle protein